MEKAMAPQSSTLPWKIPWVEEPGRLQSMGSWRVRQDWAISLSCIGEGNSNPLQSSCLENPRNGGAWLAAVYGVTQSWTRLKWVSSSSSSNLKSNHSYLCIIFIYHVCSSWCFKFLYFNNKHMNIQKIMLSENVIPKRLHDVWFHSYNTHEMTKLQKWKTD